MKKKTRMKDNSYTIERNIEALIFALRHDKEVIFQGSIISARFIFISHIEFV